MAEPDPSSQKSGRMLTPKDSNPDDSKGGATPERHPFRDAAGPEHKWMILLVELVHLLGVFLAHSRYAKNALATDTLFIQFLRHLDLLSEMPGHGSILNIRQISSIDYDSGFPQFSVQCGPLAIHGSNGWNGLTKPSAHMVRALEQAFGYFSEQGIHTMKLTFADRSKTQQERLRLTLNIIAHFHQAVENHASITFRYFGRATTIPLIHDKNSQPDLNLTLLAGLNGLSEANTRKLIKQAEAFYALDQDRQNANAPIYSYDRIFALRSLRAQLSRPPVEINLSPWLETLEENDAGPAEKGSTSHTSNGQSDTQSYQAPVSRLLTEAIESGHSLKSLFASLQAHEKDAQKLLSKVFSTDFTRISPQLLTSCFSDICTLLRLLEHEPENRISCESFLKFLQERIDRVPPVILEKMAIQRRSINLTDGNRNIVLGMMHPRLIDLVALTKERLSTQRKFAAMQALGFDFDTSNTTALAELFEINTVEAAHVLSILKACFYDGNRFRIAQFRKQIQLVVQYADTLFEMLLCYLKESEFTPARLELLAAMEMCGHYLRDVKHTFRFLLSGIYRDPFSIDFSDRNAFLMVNALFLTDRPRLNSTMERTSEDLLQKPRGINRKIQSYAAWRIDSDQVRVLTKQRTMNDLFMKTIFRRNSPEENAPNSNYFLALERETFLFFALTGGPTARIVLRDALVKYGNPSGDIYRHRIPLHSLRRILENLQIAVRGIGCIGDQKDLNPLKALERNAGRFKRLYSDPVLLHQVNDLEQRIAPTVKAIQMRK